MFVLLHSHKTPDYMQDFLPGVALGYLLSRVSAADNLTTLFSLGEGHHYCLPIQWRHSACFLYLKWHVVQKGDRKSPV